MAILVLANNSGFTVSGDGTPPYPLSISFSANTFSTNYLRLQAKNLGAYPGTWYISDFFGTTSGSNPYGDVRIYKGWDATGQLLFSNSTTEFTFNSAINVFENDMIFIVVELYGDNPFAQFQGYTFVNYSEQSQCFLGWSSTSSSITTAVPSGASIYSNNGLNVTSGSVSLISPVFGGGSVPAISFLSGASGASWSTYNLQIGDIITIDGFYIGVFGWNDISGNYYVSGLTTINGDPYAQLSCAAVPPNPSPTKLKISVQPSATSSGSLLNTQPQVVIADQNDNVVTTSNTDVSVTLYSVTGSASLSGTTTVSTVNGVADFTDLVVTGNGLFYLHFESLVLALNSVDSNQLFFTANAGNPNPPIPVKPKRSYIAGSVPSYTDLEINEFAINVADRKGYMRDSNDVVHLLFDGYANSGGGGGSGGTVYSVGLTSSDFDVSNSPITISGFINANLKTQTLTAATYGDASNVAEVTVNNKGIVTGIKNVAISYPVNSITAGTDISLTGTAPDYTINNTSPDQIVSITSGTGISVTGTYPNFTVDSTITQYTDADARLALSAGTGISYDNTTGIITNSEPDQVVSLTSGTGTNVTGTYPNFTIDCTITQYTDTDARLALSAGTGISYDNTTGVITNSEPDQIVGLTGGTDISVTGTYPNFTIDYIGTNTGVTSIIAGTGISVDQATGAVTVTNTDPDQVVLLTAGTGISVTGTYPSFTIDSTITQYTDADARLSLSAGTGISYDNTTGVITNSEPDQVVSLTGGTDIGVTGTYPNFTIDYTGTAGTGTVTSVGITSTAAALTITNSPITTSGDIGVNFAGKGSEYVTGDGSLKTFPTTIDQALNLVTEVYNSTGSTLTKGTVVYINGGQGNLPTVAKAQANSDANSAQTYGVVQADITNNNNGYVVVIGRLTDIDTQAYSTGTQLYLSPTTAGAWTTTKPSAPSHLVYVGIVVYSHPTQGVVEIKIQNGYELDEIHDVSITSVASNNILRYNSSTKLWENVAGTTSSISEGTNLYYTDSRARLSLSAGTGISYNNTTGVITNSSPDQTVVLTAGTGISTSGTYPNFTITNSAPDQTVKLTAGTGISTSGTYPNFTITNSSPDQTVTLTAGSGISVTGTYPSFTIGSTITQYTDTDARKSISAGTGISYDNTTGVITNDAPDQTVSLTAGTDISITGTYPNFTIGYSGTSGGGVTSIIAGTGISVDVSTGDVTVTNTDPDQVVSLTAGTSISITGTYPSFTITNDDPDQVVSLTAGTGISVTGTYPSFTITNSSPSSGGTVTSIATTSPITGGTITGSGTIGINASSTNTASYVVQRDASGNFAAGTITASLTGTASTATNIANGGAGQIPYNTGSGATSFLAAGTSGQVLRSNGTSAPSWESQGIFSSGRLTLESGVAVSTVDQTSKTTIYYTPYDGDKISLYDGTNWATYTFTERSLALGTLTSAKNYDVFIYNNSGTLALEALAWSTDTARSTALVLTNGVYLKSGQTTRRYLGTFRTTSTTTTEDSNSKRFLWNYNNRVNRMLLKQYVASSWTWSGTANVYRYLGNNSANSVAFVNGFQEDNIFVMASAGSSGSGIQRQLAIGFDSEWSSTLAGNSTSQYEATAVQAEASNESYQSFANRIAGLGYHVAYALELQNSTTTVNYFGGVEAGISGTWRC